MVKFGQHVPARWQVNQVLVKCMKGSSSLLSHIYTYTEISVTHKTQKYIIFHIFLNTNLAQPSPIWLAESGDTILVILRVAAYNAL